MALISKPTGFIARLGWDLDREIGIAMGSHGLVWGIMALISKLTGFIARFGWDLDCEIDI